MVIKELKNAVIDIVEFIIPPYVKLAISLLLSYFVTYGLFPDTGKNLLSNIDFSNLSTVIDNLYLSSIVPLISILLIIAIAYTINQIIDFVSSLIPVRLQSISTPKDKHLVLKIWKYFPDIENWNTLHDKINELLVDAKIKNKSSYLWQLEWQKGKVKKNLKVVNFLDFLIIWILFSYLFCRIHLKEEISPTRLIVLAFLIIILSFAMYLIIVQNQKYAEQTELMIVNQHLQSENDYTLKPVNSEKIESDIDIHLRMDKRWWWLSIGYKMDWIKMYKHLRIPIYDKYVKWKFLRKK